MKYIPKKMFTSVASPMQKAPVAAVNAPIHSFIKENPDDKYLEKLKNRIPTTSQYKVYKGNDSNFGLDKRITTGHYSLKPADEASKIIDKRFSEKGSFKQSKGIPLLEKHFQMLAPKQNYNYTDPQFYEYQLKGKTMKDMQVNAFKSQGADVDPDTLDPTARYQKWRELDKEESLNKNASKIQKLVRGRSVRENLAEGTNYITNNVDDEYLEKNNINTMDKYNG
jgi:hypothetical protein